MFAGAYSSLSATKSSSRPRAVCAALPRDWKTNNWAAGKWPETHSNDDKAKHQFFRALKHIHSSLFTYFCLYIM